MKFPKNRFASLCSLLSLLLSLMGSSVVLSSCQSSDTERPTSPAFSVSYGKIYVLYSNTSSTNNFNDSLAVCILCVNATDTLYRLRVQNGELLWTRAGKSIGAFTSSLFTANGVLYFASNNKAEGLLAVQARNGHELWHQAPGAGAFVNALDFDRTTGILYATFVPFAPPYAAAVQANNGQILWKIQPPTTSDLVYRVASGIVYQALPGGIPSTFFGGKEHYTQIDLIAMRGNDGKPLWSTHYVFS